MTPLDRFLRGQPCELEDAFECDDRGARRKLYTVGDQVLSIYQCSASSTSMCRRCAPACGGA